MNTYEIFAHNYSRIVQAYSINQALKEYIEAYDVKPFAIIQVNHPSYIHFLQSYNKSKSNNK